MSNADDQPSAGQDWGVDWRAWGTWFRLILVTGHLSLIVLGALTFSGLIVERVLHFEGSSQRVMAVVIAVLLANIGVCSNLMIVEKTRANRFNAGTFLPIESGWKMIFYFFWIGSFSLLNVLTTLEIWRILSFESIIGHSTAVIVMSAVLSFPYVVAMLRGGESNAEPL